MIVLRMGGAMGVEFTGDEFRIDQLDRSHLDHRIKFRRPATNPHAAPLISGVLLNVSPAQYVRGNVRKNGFLLTVGFPSKQGGMNSEKFGPLAAYSLVEMGSHYTEKPSRYQRDIHAEFDAAWAEEFTRYRAAAPEWLHDDLVVEYGDSLKKAKDAFILRVFGNGIDARSEAPNNVILTKAHKPEGAAAPMSIKTDLILISKAQHALCNEWDIDLLTRAKAVDVHTFECSDANLIL